jgi:DNA-directed RNA polymerase subunit RPC12/RpoP
MSSVIDLKAWREAHESAAEAFSCCTGCGSRLFRIHGTSRVRCARCSAPINLSTKATDEPGRWMRIVRSLFARER